MPCNCGGAKSKSSQYVYTGSDGKAQTFGSEVEAKAAQIRAGGGGTVKPK